MSAKEARAVCQIPVETYSGGAAFPRPLSANPHNDLLVWEQDGMTLRDYFAGKVISQCHISVIREEPEPDADVVRVYADRFARTAYVIADAMLRVRR